MAQKPVVKQVEKVAKVSKKKEAWTAETARAFIAKASTKGLKYWSAIDFLKKTEGLNPVSYFPSSDRKKK